MADRVSSGTSVTPYSPVGLSTREVLRRRAQDGANLLPGPPRPAPWRMLLRQLTHLLAVLLWVAAGLAVLAGMPQLAVAIVVIVVLNAAFAFWQEYRADRSTERLRALLPASSRVIRNGRPVTVPAAELVVGDLVLLAAGDRVAADLRLETSGALGLDESLVTGESGAVPREPPDRLMAGTFVLTGEGRATVVATGAHTTLASITDLTASAQRPPSPLTRQLGRVVQIVAVIAALTGLALGVIALLLGLPVTEAFLFGVGVAVALVPEGLLPTVTLALARGARLMAERQALVRRLDAVETLGATSFICTDKTGTLTQNRMSVVEVVTPAGGVQVHGRAYDPVATVTGPAELRPASERVAEHALWCVTGRVVARDGWVADGDPMEAALHCLALRLSVPETPADVVRRPYSADRMLSSALTAQEVAVLGAPEAVLARCGGAPPALHERLEQLTGDGRRVLAVARRSWAGEAAEAMERDLELLGLDADTRLRHPSPGAPLG
ncbi:HAD-IC family P-type ATPase, partial [Cumulibacter manganitolerans]|uniref:HAD-IC family P-type ATPase n=1 Tax=Cumulibacter manganitolerans TaxID=1884992 RepID=UPI001885E6A8